MENNQRSGHGGPGLVAGRSAREGVWRRTAHDTRRVGLSFGFLAAETSAGAICAAIGALILASPDASAFEQVVVAAATGVAGFLAVLTLCAAWSLLRAPYRQRNEARAELDVVYLEAHPEFPRHSLTVGALWYIDLDDVPVPKDTTRVILVPISFTNREGERRLSLDFDLLWSRVVHGQRLGPYTMIPYGRRSVSDVLGLPLPVTPETTVKGDLAFESALDFAFEFDDLLGVSAKAGYEIALRVTDHVTGAMIERLIESRAIEPDGLADLSPGNGTE